jgi:hypothetical protein
VYHFGEQRLYQDKWTEKDTDDKVHFSNKNFF